MSSKKPSLGRQLIAAPSLDDETILTAIVESEGDSEGALYSVMGLIAERILALKIPGGRHLVIPVATLIQRGTRQPTFATPFEEALTGLRGRLSGATLPSERMRTGLELGDRATHCAADWLVTGSHVTRVMNDEERRRFARGMACLGYGTALETAERHPKTSLSNVVRESVPPSLDRYTDVVRILRDLRPRRKAIEDALNRVWTTATIGDA